MSEFHNQTERAAPTRFGTAMLRHFGWFYHVLGLGRSLRHLELSDVSAERIRSAYRPRVTYADDLTTDPERTLRVRVRVAKRNFHVILLTASSCLEPWSRLDGS